MNFRKIIGEALQLLGALAESGVSKASENYDRQNLKLKSAQSSPAYKSDPAYKAKVDERQRQLEEYYNAHLTDEKMDQYDIVINKLKRGGK